MHTAQNGRTALVLSGGGARGAYQAGALLGLAELGITGGPGAPPFDVLVGTSAGALNVGLLAAFADDHRRGVDALVHMWSSISASDVFRTDARSIGTMGARWIRDLSLGGLTHKVAPKSLLNNAPLRDLLTRSLPVERLRRNIDQAILHALVVSAVDLSTANGVAFVDCSPATALWQRRRWSVEQTAIGVEHLMASSAIPVFFPSVPIGGRWFGDGSVRNTNPLSPAIHLGARRILTIGVRSAVGVPEANPWTRPPEPTIAEIAGVLLDAVMLDAIEMDVAHSRRVNRGVLACGQGPDFPFSHVDLLWLAPSLDIGQIAADLADEIPPIVRYLLRGLGNDQATTELASYLLFDATYCTRLVELGRKDAWARAEEIRSFFESTGDSD